MCVCVSIEPAAAVPTTVSCNFAVGPPVEPPVVFLEVNPVIDGVFDIILVSTEQEIGSFQFDILAPSGNQRKKERRRRRRRIRRNKTIID